MFVQVSDIVPGDILEDGVGGHYSGHLGQVGMKLVVGSRPMDTSQAHHYGVVGDGTWWELTMLTSTGFLQIDIWARSWRKHLAVHFDGRETTV